MIHTQTKYYTIYNDSCLTVLDSLEPNSIDCIITDPPYEIGFMSKGWDNTGIAFNVDTWKKALRVLKSGGYLLAFNHSRTFHRMAVAIEDAGFEIRDTIMWLYGSGFPESNGGTGETKIYQSYDNDIRLNASKEVNRISFGDSGSASRFFYTAKASKKDRDEGLDVEPKYTASAEFRPNHMEKALRGEDGNPYGRWQPRKNIHPTVKPTDLMQYLIRLVAPKGSIVLDIFMGSGTTGKAVMIENNERNANYHFIGIDLEKEYCDIAKARIEYGINYKENKAKEKEKEIVDEGQTSIFDF